MKQSSVGVGVIGAGAFTEFCLSAYRKYLKEAELVAVADLDMAVAQSVADHFEIKNVAASPAELIQREDIDLVIILTPPLTHFGLTLEALRAGKNVLVEKPIALTSRQAKKLTKLAAQKNLHLASNLVLRYHPFHQQLRQAVKSRQYGQLRQINTTALLARYPADHWYWKPKISGGFFLNTYCHFIDLYNYIVDARPKRFASLELGRYQHAISLAFDNCSANLTTNLDVANELEAVVTSYVFDQAIIKTQGWLPENMEITSIDGQVKNFASSIKTELYQNLLSQVLVDLIKRIKDPHYTGLLDEQVLEEAVRQSELVERLTKRW